MENYNQAKKYHQFLKFKKYLKKYSVTTARGHEIFLLWLRSKLSRNQFLIISGILVGFSAGFAGVILKLLVSYIHFFITQKVHFSQQVLFYLIFPFLGIVLTTLIVILFFQGQDKKGIPAILFEIAQNSSLVSRVKMYSQILQSAITVGLGGSAGLESPIAVTGAAIGSNYARTYQLDYKDRTLLLASGATAGIACAFNAPVAGVMFAFEILLTGVVFTDFIPLVVAAVCGSLLSKVVLKEEILFHFKTMQPFNYNNILYYLILGICCGLYARYFLFISHHVEHFFKTLKLSKMRKAMVGGVILSLLCVLLPPLFGEGYQTVKELNTGQIGHILHNSFFRSFTSSQPLVILFLVLVLAFKAVATSITIQSGGNGGNFAPSLFAGGTFGFMFAAICSYLGLSDIPSANLVIVGMAGVMSGVLYAPLTAIFLIAESSGGYDLFIPLMIVSVISYLIAIYFSPISPDIKELADKGKIFTREYDKNLLLLLDVTKLIERDAQCVNIDASFETLLDGVKKGRRNVMAVVNEGGHLEGTITIDDLRAYMFSPEPPGDITVRKIAKVPPTVITPEDTGISLIRKFDESNTWNLPVITKDGKFIGFISKSTVLNQYRQLLKQYS